MTAKRAPIVRLRTRIDGSVMRALPGGKARRYKSSDPDHGKLDRLSDVELTARALADPDNPPLDDETLCRMALAGRVKSIRMRAGLSQTAFARRYGIPVGTLRDWEYGRRAPDTAALTLLKVIDRNPKAVAQAVTGQRAAARA